MKSADIVMLCAGTSSRMGRINKMLLPYKGMSLAAFSCLEALKYLSSLEKGGNLIVVTGYRRPSLLKSLKPCIDFVENTSSPVKMIVVHNGNYRNGQFSSTKTGVREVRENAPFFISLADMPEVLSGHYEKLGEIEEGVMAVRPFVNGVPGHPVLHASSFREKILNAPDDCSVSRLLKKEKVCEPQFTDPSWIKDLDTQEDLTSSRIL